MEFTLNNISKSYNGNPELPLLTYLREIEGITSAKDAAHRRQHAAPVLLSLTAKLYYPALFQ